MRRATYVLKRAGVAALTIFAVVTFNFVLFRILPGDRVADLSRARNLSDQARVELRADFGLDRSIQAQYLLYLRELVRGNLGISFVDRQPVATNLARSLANTIPMVAIGTFLAILVGSVAGILSVRWQGSPADPLIVGASMVIYSLPTQWLGLMLLILAAGHFPSGGMRDEFLINPTFLARTADTARHMVLPVLTLVLTLFGQYALIVRASILETLGEDFVLSARAQGHSRDKVLFKTVLRNSLPPVVALIALSLGTIVGGAILVETVFSWPGVGREVFASIAERDYPMLQGAFLVLTLSVVLFNFVGDLVMLRLDPRVAA